MKNVSEYNLTDLVASWAVEIFEQSQDQDEALELASQYADGTEWVIYHYKAHQLCAAVNTDNGEAMLEDIGIPDGATYDSLASLIAYFEIEARLNEALETLFDIAAANDQAAIELVNDFVESQVEYETLHQDAGDNYAHMTSESWDDQKTRDLESALNAETRDFAVKDHFAPASYKSACEILGVDSRWKSLDSETLSDLALEAFTMQAGSIHGPFDGGVVLDAYAVQEIEIELQHLEIPQGLDRIKDSCDCYIQGNLAYQSTDAVWFAVLDVETFNTLIADHFDA